MSNPRCKETFINAADVSGLIQAGKNISNLAKRSKQAKEATKAKNNAINAALLNKQKELLKSGVVNIATTNKNSGITFTPNKPKGIFGFLKKKKERFESPEEQPAEEVQKDQKFDDQEDTKCQNHFNQQVGDKQRTMYGLKTDSNRINFGLGIDKKYTTDNYNTIIMNEIGKDAIESQKDYCSYLVNDSSLRYIDTSIEANYGDYHGLSLSRVANPAVGSLNATQQPGIDASEYQAPGSMLDYYKK